MDDGLHSADCEEGTPGGRRQWLILHEEGEEERAISVNRDDALTSYLWPLQLLHLCLLQQATWRHEYKTSTNCVH